MASLVRGPSGVYNIKFRWNGRQFLKSTKEHDKRAARNVQAFVDDTLNKLRTGRTDASEPPQGVDAGDWILSGCKMSAPVDSIALDAASDAYKADNIGKASTTRDAEAKHLRHLCRILGGNTRLDRVTLKMLKAYCKTRLGESNRLGGKVTGSTVKKELLTFTQLWAWGTTENHVKGVCPVKQATDPSKWAIRKLPKSKGKDFATWDQITEQIRRQKIPDDKQAKLWAGLYLDDKQVDELLTYVSRTAKQPFVPILFYLAACAGLRRSEILNMEVANIRLDEGIIIVSEHKRDKSKSGTKRRIMMSDSLKAVLAKYIRKYRTTGTYLIVGEDGDVLTSDAAVYHFKDALYKSKWDVVPGYHCLRHSFASICLRKGIPIHVTARWMGHTTQAMIDLYQKLYPQDEKEWVKRLA